MTNSLGTLYLVATPIGNLEDLSYRAVRVLKEASELYCEDTRRTGILLSHYKIERKGGLKSFHDHSPSSVLAKIKETLNSGESIAYVTDGGMPVVSDPGFVLVRQAHQIGAKVEVIPGPSAAVTLFCLSGLASPKYFFHGFFPQTRGEIEKVLEMIKTIPVAHIFYESPSRVTSSVEILMKSCNSMQVVLGRELTKMHEEVLRGTAAEVHENLSAREKVRGECVLAAMGGWDLQKNKSYSIPTEAGEGQIEVIELSEDQKKEIVRLIQSGGTSKDVSKELSKKFGVPRRVIYDFIIKNIT